MSLTATQKELVRIVERYVTTEVLDKQFAFRDILTDMRHVADHLELDWKLALEGALDVYEQEKEDN